MRQTKDCTTCGKDYTKNPNALVLVTLLHRDVMACPKCKKMWEEQIDKLIAWKRKIRGLPVIELERG